jgi:PRTRC genetic system protein E
MSDNTTPQSFFQALYSVMHDKMDVNINVQIMDDGRFGIIVNPNFHKDRARDLAANLVGITMFGTAEEMDTHFLEKMVVPFGKVVTSITNAAEVVERAERVATSATKVASNKIDKAAKTTAFPADPAQQTPEEPAKPAATDEQVQAWAELLTPTTVRRVLPQILDRYRTESAVFQLSAAQLKRLDLLEKAAETENKKQKAYPRGLLDSSKIEAMEKHLANGNPWKGVQEALDEYEYTEAEFDQLEQLYDKFKDNGNQAALF